MDTLTAENMGDARSQAQSNPVSAKPALSRRQIFFRRLSSTAILWSIVLLAIFAPNRTVAGSFFLVIMVFLSASGLVEFYGLVKIIGLPCYKTLGIIGGLALNVGTFFFVSGAFVPNIDPKAVNDFETGFLVLFVLGLCLRQFFCKTNPKAIIGISTTLLGLMYVPWLLNFVQKLNFYPGLEGKYFMLHFILVTKFSDLGAYVTGSLIGKHKMIPRISPGKTWEGFGGAIVIATGISVGYAALNARHLAGMTTIHAIAIGIILSVAAVVGDLIESIFKREAGVKDSGHLFPGIGGILDLVDSLLFNAPIMYLYLRHILT